MLPQLADEDSRRRHQRLKLSFRAGLRKAGTLKFDVDVLDLSVSGFSCLTAYTMPVGSTLWLTIPGLGGIEATIAWRRDFLYGCEFLTPLHPAVLDHLARRLARR